ncbi:hypothetical protein CASFOL_038225 [Castilleja foliolosa]|uniref:Uncharacterized protein n=1 Tax=Castilleja foliolosa TaxID=1961234 RepID=A0ABD3BL61_9LAMI
MVGAPISYPGHQPHHPSSTGTNPQSQAYATPSAPLSTLLPYDGRRPQGPASYSDGLQTSSAAPLNTSYLYPPTTNPQSPFSPTSAPYPGTSATAPPPFPPFSTSQGNQYNPNPANVSHAYPPLASPYPSANHSANPGQNQGNTSNAYPQYAQPPAAYPPAGYPPQQNNPQAPSGYPTGQPSGSYGQPTSAYPPTSTYPQGNPTNQPPHYSAGNYSAPPPAGGAYPPRY